MCKKEEHFELDVKYKQIIHKQPWRKNSTSKKIYISKNYFMHIS